MRNRIIKSTIAISAVIIIAAIVGLYHSYSRYTMVSRDIMENYESNGRNLSMLIEEAFNNSILMVNSFEENLYNEMVKDLFALYPLSSNRENIFSEGFFFSDIPDSDSFTVYTYYDGRKYSISRGKKWYADVEKISGPGKYIQNIGNIKAIKYIIVQDDIGIITATDNVDSIYSIISDRELMYAMVEHEDIFRQYEIYGDNVYEYIHPMNDNALLRIGFDDKPVKNSIMQTRILFVSIAGTMAVFVMLFIIIVILYMRNISTMEHINTIDRQNTIYLNQLDEGVIIIRNGHIQMINRAAMHILDSDSSSIEQLIISDEIFDKDNSNAKELTNKQMHYSDKDILYTKRYVEDDDYTIITFSDITKFNRLKKDNEIKQKQAMLGELTFKVAHELKNPLNGMYMILQRIMEHADSSNRALLNEAIEEVGRMNSRIVEFTRFARPIDYKMNEVNSDELIKDVVRNVRREAEMTDIVIDVNIEPCIIICDYEQMYIALKNIVINAIDSINSNGRISIEGTCQNDYIIYIKDNGAGMDDSIRSRAAELYFTTKPEGSGIGLANAQKIITEHQGHLAIESVKGQGTTVTVTLKTES